MTRLSGFLIITMLLLFAFAVPVGAQDAVSDLLGRINGLRGQLGLAPYSLQTQLTLAAQNQASWMATTGEVSHTQPDGSRPRDRAQAVGYPSAWVSENIYMGPIARAADAWQFWVNSPIHYAGMTSPNYQEIGIATANGSGGNAFVLVFGAPGGYSASVAAADSNAASGSNGGVPQQPSYVVGVDQYGNIMHEIQPGDTLGDLLLIYGYTWEDLPELLALNGLTDADIRELDIGAVLLVPPQSGTYTPEPTATETAQVTETAPAPENASITETALPPESTPDSAQPVTSTPRSVQAAPSLTPLTGGGAADLGILPTPEPPDPNAAEQVLPPATYVAAVLEPTTSPTRLLAISTLPVATLVAAIGTPDIQTQTTPQPPSDQPRFPLWVVGLIVLQIGILAFAAVEYFRRQRTNGS